jgi:hypothetical protein
MDHTLKYGSCVIRGVAGGRVCAKTPRAEESNPQRTIENQADVTDRKNKHLAESIFMFTRVQNFDFTKKLL